MNDEGKLREAVELGENAKRLLEDETLQEAFDRLKSNFRIAWEDSEPENTDGREKFYYGLRAVHFVEQELRIMLDNGKVAASQIERDE